MLKSKILISKDAMGKFYLPVYGNQYWEMPNLAELAKHGTVFDHHYTAAPSTAMALTSMFTGLYPYQTERKYYLPVGEDEHYENLFDKAAALGYQCHIVWEKFFDKMAKRFTECYGSDTTWHWLEGTRQGVGAQFPHEGHLVPDDESANSAVKIIEDCLRNIVGLEGPQFVWMHLPHVFNGRTGYGSDMDVFDRVIGISRELFGDDSVYITSDHGNMNGCRGKYCYGFDVYEPSISIPLITPRLENLERCSFNTVNKDLFALLFEDTILRNDFIYSDSAYYAQPHRKLAIINGSYRYIFNKEDGSEELYDIDFDPGQTRNLISDTYYDVDRKMDTPLREMYFYTNWDKVEQMREVFRKERKRIWRQESRSERLHGKIEDTSKQVFKQVRVMYRKVKGV